MISVTRGRRWLLRPRSRHQAVDGREHDERVGADEHRHQRPEHVVVAKPDLLDRHRVVLVDDRYRLAAQQVAHRVASVQVAVPRMQVRMGEQHLPDGQAVNGIPAPAAATM